MKELIISAEQDVFLKHSFHNLSYIGVFLQYRNMRWAGHVARMGEEGGGCIAS